MNYAKHCLAPPKLVAFALLIFSSGFGIASWRLGLWANGAPGVGLTPLIGCALLFPISLLILADPIDDAEPAEPLEWVPVLTGLGFGLVIYAMTVLGFAIPAFLFVLIWTRILYARTWLVSVTSSIAITAVLAIMFVIVLGVPLQLLSW